ncbi:MAG: hypothetical protein DI539_22260 [Flavobacterium psychrophilum]|nr:MAG: hypothetical protein DI539_22260 [Flavobacterium psychrophilum]
MSLLVDYDDLENKGFDGGGGEILYYKDEPFTGFIVDYYENGRLASEEEYKDSYKDGAVRQYFENGQIEEEYFIKYHRLYDSYKLWDSNGILIMYLLYNNDGNVIERLIG